MLDRRHSMNSGTLRKLLKQFHYPFEVKLTGMRRYVAYLLSLHFIEKLMEKRGAFVYRVTVYH